MCALWRCVRGRWCGRWWRRWALGKESMGLERCGRWWTLYGVSPSHARVHAHTKYTKHAQNTHTICTRISGLARLWWIIVTDIMLALSSLSHFPLNTFLAPSHLRHGRLWRHRRIRVPRCRRPSRRHHSQPGVACEHGASAADSARQGSAKGESKAWVLTVLGLSPEGQWSRSDKVAEFPGAGYSRT